MFTKSEIRDLKILTRRTPNLTIRIQNTRHLAEKMTTWIYVDAILTILMEVLLDKNPFDQIRTTVSF